MSAVTRPTTSRTGRHPATGTRPGPGKTPPRAARIRPASARRRSRTGDLATDTAQHLLIDLLHAPDDAAGLPRGKADGRYTCPLCGHPVEFCGPRSSASVFTARFRHTPDHPDHCPAGAQRQAQLRTAVADAWQTADHLAVRPGLRVRLTITAPACEADPIPLLAIVLDDGTQATTVHLANGAMTTDQADLITRNRGNRDRDWVLFDRHDPDQHQEAGTVHVRHLRHRLTHSKITPTPVQRRLAAADLAVAWHDHGVLHLPYGGHPFTYEPQPGEDWSGNVASWRHDWKISQPRPADGATWWGLLPVPLRALAVPEQLAAAMQMMTGLQTTQSGRESYRRGLARDQYNRRRPVQLTRTTAAETHPIEQAKAPIPPEPPSPTRATDAALPRVGTRGRGWRWRSLLGWLRRR
jgi:hypothetical protein